MKRGDLYRVNKPSADDPKKYRIFVIISRQELINSNYSSVICAPVYTVYNELNTQIPIGVDEGLKHDSSIHCDALMSLPKTLLTNYIGQLSLDKIQSLNYALKISLNIDNYV
jgi:mRNA interferase MazF